MGKAQEDTPSGGVKREVVSASSLEVVSPESFLKRLEGMSSCANCTRERTRVHRVKPNRKGKGARRKQNQQQANPKAASPIVVHLKDTLRNSKGLSPSSTETDHSRSSEEDQPLSVSPRVTRGPRSNGNQGHHSQRMQNMNSSDRQRFSYRDFASVPEFVPSPGRSYYVPIHQAYHPQFHHYYHVPHVSPGGFPPALSKPSLAQTQQMLQAVREKTKNDQKLITTALISVLGKGKENKEPVDHRLNLTKNSLDMKNQLMNTLNNFSSSSMKDEESSKRSNISDLENIKLIKNDFSDTADKVVESTDESDTSDKASVASSSDTLSDDMGEGDLLQTDSVKKMSRDELEQLAEFTSGVPLIKYDVPAAHHCPECVTAWYAQQYQHTHDSHQGHQDRPFPSSSSKSALASSCRHHASHKRTVSTAFQSPRGSVSSESDMSSPDLSSDVEDSSSSSSSSTSPSPPPPASPPPVPTSSSTWSSLHKRAVTTSVKNLSGSSLYQKPHARERSGYNQAQRKPKFVVPRCNTFFGGNFDDKENRQPKQQQQHHQNSHNHYSHDGHDHPSQDKATWQNGRQLWDIDVSMTPTRRPEPHHLEVKDSVFMDLTGLAVTYSVVYHNEPPPMASSTWPYPVSSLYQAVYSSHQTLHSRLNLPLPLASLPPVYRPMRDHGMHALRDTHVHIPAPDRKKYDMVVPPVRPWIPTGSPEKDVPSAMFSVMCYNVLCDKLCTKSMYAYCPTWALNWDYRKDGIMRDIRRGDGDIITLQEVETEQYYCTFLPELAREGYDGIFLPKSRVRTMNSDKEKKSVDGCAIFYKKNKFEKVNEYQIEFSQLATKEGANNTDTDMINRVSTKDNIAIVAVLRTKPAVYENSPVPAPKGLSQMLMVSTAHIHWDPQLPDVKLVQTMMLIEELQKFVKETSMQFRPNAPPPSVDTDLCNSMPLILCGDFNSLPDSGVYEFISKGRLDASHKDFEGQNYREFMKDRKENNVITHNFKLKSAYKDVIPFTNYTYDFKGIIDYVFFSEAHLRLHTVMGLQDEEWFKANKIVGCPHPFVPSDHFPLFAEFSLPYYSHR